MKFTKGTAVVFAGHAWSVIDADTETGQYQIESLDGTSRGWVSESEVLRAP